MSPSEDDDDDGEEENEEGLGEFTVDGFKGALIAEDDSRPSWEEFKRTAQEESEEAGGLAGRALEYNWKYGFCRHYVSFEGSDTIRRFKFMGDLMAFGMINGQVALIRLSTGEILDRFKEHDCEVTSIDFDGINLVSGAADGKIVHYSLTYGLDVGSGEADTTTDLDALLSAPENTANDTDPSADTVPVVPSVGRRNRMGSSKQVYGSFHTRSVTSVKLVNLPATKNAAEKTLMVSTSMDKSLHCVDIATGESVYSLEVDKAPICMDAISSSESGNSYLCVGTIDGNVLVKSAKNGRTLLNFQADDRVRSIHFTSESIIVTGGNSGSVKRWDLDAKEGTSRVSAPSKKRNQRQRQRQQAGASGSGPAHGGDQGSPGEPSSQTARPTQSSPSAKGARAFRNTGRFIDFYFQAAIENQGAEEDSGADKGGGGASSAGAGGSTSSRGLGKTTPSPTVEKAASAMRTKAAGREASNTSGRAGGSMSGASDEAGEEEGGVARVDKAAALGGVMSERQRVYKGEGQSSPVVAVHADDTKIFACYEDGIIKAWDVESMVNLFDLQGRTNLISCCQFDATRLIADGTHHIIVTHDFSDYHGEEDSSESVTLEYTGSPAEDPLDEEGEEQEEDGKPGATS